MKLSSVLQQLLQEGLIELSKIGTITGTQEKRLNTGLRKIHHQFADDEWIINKHTKSSSINYGGCGIFAKLLYYNLKKYLNIVPKIVVLAPIKPQRDINSYQTAEAFNHDSLVVHIILQVGDYYLDSSGIHKQAWFKKIYSWDGKYFLDGMSIQTLTKWVKTSDGWNPTFNRYDTDKINKAMVRVIKQAKSLGIK